MRRILLVSFIAFLAMGLYGQEKDTVQTKPKIKLELVWEKEFPEGIVDISFDKESMVPQIIITGKSPFSAKSVYFFDSNGIVIGKKELTQHDGYAEAKLSENGKFVAIFEPDNTEYGLESYKGTIKIYNSKGNVHREFYVIDGVSWLSNDGNVVIGQYLDGEVTLRITSSLKSYNLSTIRDSTWLDIPGEFFRVWGDYVVVGATKTSNGFAGFKREQENLQFSGFLNTEDYLYWINKDTLYIVNESGSVVQEYKLNKGGSYSLAISPNLRWLAILQQKFRDVYLIDISTSQIIWKWEGEPVKWHPWKTINVADSGQIVIGEVSKSFHFFNPLRQIVVSGELPDDAVIISSVINAQGNKIVITTASGWIRCYSVFLSTGGEK